MVVGKRRGWAGGDAQEATALWVLTLILQLESWPVLGVVAVEIHSGLMGCGEQGAWKLATTESAHHAAGLVGAIPDLYEVVVGLSGEVQELDVSPWDQERGRQCPKQWSPALNVRLHGSLFCQTSRIPTTGFPPEIARTQFGETPSSPIFCLEAGLNLKIHYSLRMKGIDHSRACPESILFY